MNDKFHQVVVGVLILVYLYLVIRGQINVAGFEYMVGSIVGGLFGFRYAQSQSGGLNVPSDSKIFPEPIQKPGVPQV